MGFASPATRIESPAPASAGREAWIELVENRCGTYFAEGRLHVLDSGVRERMRILGESDSRRYYDFVLSDRTEWKQLLRLLLNGETSFYRHAESFETLREGVFPNLDRERPARAWCAGCSTGEEVYSIAALGFPMRVLGTDLNEIALAKAAAGVYPPAEVPAGVQGFRRTARGLEASAALRSAVSFEVLNLLDVEAYPANQDLIWCQNVLIYCRDWLRSRIVAGFERSLRPGGFLLLSPVDAMFVRPASLDPVRVASVPLFRKTFRKPK